MNINIETSTEVPKIQLEVLNVFNELTFEFAFRRHESCEYVKRKKKRRRRAPAAACPAVSGFWRVYGWSRFTPDSASIAQHPPAHVSCNTLAPASRTARQRDGSVQLCVHVFLHYGTRFIPTVNERRSGSQEAVYPSQSEDAAFNADLKSIPFFQY